MCAPVPSIHSRCCSFVSVAKHHRRLRQGDPCDGVRQSPTAGPDRHEAWSAGRGRDVCPPLPHRARGQADVQTCRGRASEHARF
jgi:hypothetical protein